MINVKEYNDGIVFNNEDDSEIAFFSYITNRVTFQNNAYPGWKEFNCSSIPFEDLLFITNISNLYRNRKRR